MSHRTHSLCKLCSLVSLTEREDSAPEGTESNATLVVDGDKRVKRRLLMGRRLPHPSLATVVDPLPLLPQACTWGPYPLDQLDQGQQLLSSQVCLLFPHSCHSVPIQGPGSCGKGTSPENGLVRVPGLPPPGEWP